MAGITNRGYSLLLDWALRDSAPAGGLYLALLTAASAPTETTDTFSSPLVEIAPGGTYAAGGLALSRNSTDFSILTEEDLNHRAYIRVRDVTWTGPVPGSGAGARYAILTTGEATQGQRQVVGWWDLSVDRSVGSGSPLTLSGLELRLIQT